MADCGAPWSTHSCELQVTTKVENKPYAITAAAADPAIAAEYEEVVLSWSTETEQLLQEKAGGGAF